ncbi:MAG: hypothetical protein ACOVQM_10955 [Pirellula sp.]|jgi:hypothetical protein
MTNPYVPPVTGAPEANSSSSIKKWTGRQLLTAIASGMAVGLLAIVSFVLIMQALRLNSESATLPVRLQADYAATANSSWVGGTVAFVGMLLNVAGLFLVLKNKLALPIAMIAISVAGMVVIAILFKP